MEKDVYVYDVALSFAGEDREYVEQVAILLKSYGVKVFYDKFEETNLWGKNLFEYLNNIYKSKARFTVMFISKYYNHKLWTNHKRKSMQERAFNESSEYILPARFDDTEIPGLHSTISYVNLIDKSPIEFTQLILEKINWELKNRWWGKWEIETPIVSYNSSLQIYKVTQYGFDFELSTSNGAHLGSVSGFAKFNSTNDALFRVKEDEEMSECQIRFIKTNDIIQISESPGCLYYHGMRAYFDGDYKIQKDIFYDLGLLNDTSLSLLYQLLDNGKHWDSFIKCFSDIHFSKCIDNFDGRVITGAVPGLYTSYEAIIIIKNETELFGAFLDVDKVYYFTSVSDYKSRIPETIENWRNRFKEIEIIFVNNG